MARGGMFGAAVVGGVLILAQAAYAQAPPVLQRTQKAVASRQDMFPDGWGPSIDDALSRAPVSDGRDGRARAECDATAPRERHDSVLNGLLIGTGIGVGVGFGAMPRAICSGNDSECTAIVRAVLGLPSIAVGAAVGVLIDHAITKEVTVGTMAGSKVSVGPSIGPGQVAFRMTLRPGDRRGR